MLNKYSDEQYDVITKIKYSNVIVDSVAGSGKTTCCLHIALEYPNLKILLLTYNSKLKIETREKVEKIKIKNIETHTYHSFCVKYYDNKCFTDTVINSIIKTNKKNKKFQYDLIILDESQDITPLYYQLICKIYKDNIKKANICLFGDKYQSIYDFSSADERYIVLADKIFNFNDFPWEKCKLSYSFRITTEMANFINNCMIHYERIRAHKISIYKSRYIICDTFCDYTNFTFKEIEYYLNLNYLPQDFFILAPSIKSIKSPVRVLENIIKEKRKDIPIFVPVSDEEKLDKDVLKGKMVFSTFHQAKGLERKIVIIFNFDLSYFIYYKKNKNPYICPNELYVATTRALEHITLFHHYRNDYLPFLNLQNLGKFTTFIEYEKVEPSPIKDDFIRETAPTDLIKNIPSELLDNCITYLDIKIIQPKTTPINIDTKTIQKFGYENVSEITGTAIPSYYEYMLKNKMSIYNKLIQCTSSNDEGECLFEDETIEDDKNLKSEIILENIKLNVMTTCELLYIANRWCSYMCGYVFKLDQITKYEWLSKDNLDKCIANISHLGISKNAIFEQKCNKEIMNTKITGFTDCIDNKNIYEFKCTKELSKEHYLQLAIYAYLNECEHVPNVNNSEQLSIGLKILYTYKGAKCNGIITHIYKNSRVTVKNEITNEINKIFKKNIIKEEIIINNTTYNYYLYNILTDELLQIGSTYNKLQEMMKLLIFNKYNSVIKLSDDQFLNKVTEMRKKYYS